MSRFRRNVVANYVGGAWAAVMGIAFVPFYIKYLGVEAFGLIGFYIALQAWLVVMDLGFTQTINREMAKFDSGELSARHAHELLLSLEVIYFLVTLVTLTIIYLCAPFIAGTWLSFDHLTLNEVINTIRIMGFTVCMRWMSTLYRGAMMGLQRQVWLSSIGAFFATLRGPGAILILAYVSNTVEAFFLCQAVIYALEALVVRVRLHAVLPSVFDKRLNLSGVTNIWRFTAGVAGINVLGMLLTQMDKMLLSATMSLEDLGYYTLASTVAGALFVLISPIAMATYPRYTELISEGDWPALEQSYRSSSELLAAILIPVSVVLSVFSMQILWLWTGDVALALNSGDIMTILVLGTMLNGLLHLPHNMQLASGWTSLIIKVNMVAVLVYLPIVYAGILSVGIIAPALFWFGFNLIFVVFVVPLMHVRLVTKSRESWFRNSVFSPLAASAAVVFIASLVSPDIHNAGWLGGLLLIVVILFLAVTAGVISTPIGRIYSRALFGRLRLRIAGH